jgi:glycine cleavage system H protein
MSIARFTTDHQWVRIDGADAVVGITDYAQTQLGDIVHVDLPEVGKRIEKGKEIAIVESVKAASELYAPISGEVTDVNTALADDPTKINADPMGEGWFLKLRVLDARELDVLMDEASYRKFIDTLAVSKP